MIFGHDEYTPCFDDPYPFDVLMDMRSGPEYALALLEASEMCSTCPVRAVCHAENAGEPWVDPVARKLAGEHVETARRKRKKKTT